MQENSTLVLYQEQEAALTKRRIQVIGDTTDLASAMENLGQVYLKDQQMYTIPEIQRERKLSKSEVVTLYKHLRHHSVGQQSGAQLYRLVDIERVLSEHPVTKRQQAGDITPRCTCGEALVFGECQSCLHKKRTANKSTLLALPQTPRASDTLPTLRPPENRR